MRPGRSTILSLALIGVSPPATAAAQQPAQAGPAAPPVRAPPPPYAPGWQDGHVDVAAGDRLTLTVTRLPTGRGPRRDNYAANGAPPFPQFPRGAVIATIGGPPFLVESSRSIVASAPGHLRLAVNFGTTETENPIPAFTVSVRLTPGTGGNAADPDPADADPADPDADPDAADADPADPDADPDAADPDTADTADAGAADPDTADTAGPDAAGPDTADTAAPPKAVNAADAAKAAVPDPVSAKADSPRGPSRRQRGRRSRREPGGPAAILALAVLLALLAGAGLETGRRIRARRQIRKPPLLAFSPRLERGEGGVTGDEIATTGPEVRLRAMLEPGETFFDGSEPEVRNG